MGLYFLLDMPVGILKHFFLGNGLHFVNVAVSTFNGGIIIYNVLIEYLFTQSNKKFYWENTH